MTATYRATGAVATPGRIRATRYRPWRVPVGIQSLFAAGLGALIGWAEPIVGVHLGSLSTVFIGVLQMMVLPLVFPMVAATVARAPSVRAVGRLAAKSLTFFLFVTTVALVIAACLAAVCGIGVGAMARVASVRTSDSGPCSQV